MEVGALCQEGIKLTTIEAANMHFKLFQELLPLMEKKPIASASLVNTLLTKDSEKITLTNEAVIFVTYNPTIKEIQSKLKISNNKPNKQTPGDIVSEFSKLGENWIYNVL